jgi:stage IV sporulation protein FB
MFGFAGETQFDVHFRILGIPVRIHPVFWLSSAFLAWNPANGRIELVFLGIICVLVSILVHEMGHAIASRRFGYPSEIVLFFLGGYATSARFSTWKNVTVSAAGPAFGFILFGIVYSCFSIIVSQWPTLLRDYDAIPYCVHVMLFANLMWNVMNLVPCLPLDGGRIMQSLIDRYVGIRATERVIQVSIVASAAVALWAIYCLQQWNQGGDIQLIPFPQVLIPKYPVRLLQPGAGFLAFFFGYMCAQHVIYYNNTIRRIF